MTEQAKHQALLVDRLRHMVVHARRQGGFAVGQRGVGGHARDRQPGEAPVGADSRVASRPSISGICMSISTASNGTLASSTCLNARQPAVGEDHPGALAAQQLGGDLAVQRVVLHYQQTHALARWVRSTGRGGGLAGAPCSPCNACSTESASCLGVTGLVKIDEGRRAVVARIGQHLAAIGGDHDHHGRRQVALQLADQLRRAEAVGSGMRQSISTTS